MPLRAASSSFSSGSKVPSMCRCSSALGRPPMKRRAMSAAGHRRSGSRLTWAADSRRMLRAGERPVEQDETHDARAPS